MTYCVNFHVGLPLPSAASTIFLEQQASLPCPSRRCLCFVPFLPPRDSVSSAYALVISALCFRKFGIAGGSDGGSGWELAVRLAQLQQQSFAEWSSVNWCLVVD